MASANRKLLTWYRRHRRPLPWRLEPHPYRVWVSELMLQQTQVATVVPYFERFIERFPDVASLAGATEEQVLSAWSGLGYYRRARALHRGAQSIVESGGEFPEDVEGWMALPGVGRYTAGAIVSIALGKSAPILDGNVARVLSRRFAIRGDPRKGPANRELWRLAEEILPPRAVGDFNQALMELGALVCLPTKPKCLLCPLRTDCRALADGLVDVLPERLPRPVNVAVSMAAAVVRERGRYLLFQRQGQELMRGLWEFPNAECRADESPELAVVREARETYGIRLDALAPVATIRHHVMNRRIDLHAFRASRTGPVASETRHRWVSERELTDVPVSSVVRKILHAVES